MQRLLQQGAEGYERLEFENDRLARIDAYYRERLIPSYDNALQLQKQTLEVTEAESLELKAKSRDLEEKYAQVLELLQTQNQKVDRLQAEIQVLSEAMPSHDPQPPTAMRKRLRPRELVKKASAKRAMKYRLEKPTKMEPSV